ncbi:hypothetical protein BJ741DRAFT_46165 [Chytriomyces cf. hyalinus JEL632]|nr:hypothetical protein BJ741DRAFT_46165 [Chytriomyces cf. hyalinus JEL632]
MTVFILLIHSIDVSVFLFLIVESSMAPASDFLHFAVTITFPTHANEPSVTLDLCYQFQTRSLTSIGHSDKQIRPAVVHTSETTIFKQPAEIENPVFHHLFLSKQHNLRRVKTPKKKPPTHPKPTAFPHTPQPPPALKFISHPTPTETLRVSFFHGNPQARVQLSSRHYLNEINLAREVRVILNVDCLVL